MLPRHRVSTAGTALAVALICASGTRIDSAGQATSRPAGLFTEAQATSGAAIYRQSCASCHGADLTGGSAPSLAGTRLAAAWSNPQVTLDDLFFVLRTTMPPRASSALSAGDHAAVFAYILKANGFAPGATPLTAESAELKSARFATSAQPAARATTAQGQPPAFIPGAAGSGPAASGPDQATLSAAASSTDWLFHSNDYAGKRI